MIKPLGSTLKGLFDYKITWISFSLDLIGSDLRDLPDCLKGCVVCGTVYALKRSPGINRKSRVSYPGPGFLSSATWPSLPKKHFIGLNQNFLSTVLEYCHI